MVNPILYTITRYRCAKCGEVYKFEGEAEYCCSKEEIEKYGE